MARGEAIPNGLNLTLRDERQQFVAFKPIEAGEVTFDDVPPGKYAVLVNSVAPAVHHFADYFAGRGDRGPRHHCSRRRFNGFKRFDCGWSRGRGRICEANGKTDVGSDGRAGAQRSGNTPGTIPKGSKRHGWKSRVPQRASRVVHDHRRGRRVGIPVDGARSAGSLPPARSEFDDWGIDDRDGAVAGSR